jgi:hypothetical protein
MSARTLMMKKTAVGIYYARNVSCGLNEGIRGVPTVASRMNTLSYENLAVITGSKYEED